MMKFPSICLFNMICFVILVISLFICQKANAFIMPISSTQRTQLPIIHHQLSMAKGFGKDVSSNKPKKVNDNNNGDGEEPSSSTSENAIENMKASPSTQSTTTAGADALARLRRQKAEQKDEELRAIREMKSMDELVSNDPDAAVIPEQVAQRMGKRMLPFVGIPLFGVMGTFVLFWYLATYRNMEFQPALVAFSTIGVLGVSLLVRRRKKETTLFFSFIITFIYFFVFILILIGSNKLYVLSYIQ